MGFQNIWSDLLKNSQAPTTHTCEGQHSGGDIGGEEKTYSNGIVTRWPEWKPPCPVSLRDAAVVITKISHPNPLHREESGQSIGGGSFQIRSGRGNYFHSLLSPLLLSFSLHLRLAATTVAIRSNIVTCELSLHSNPSLSRVTGMGNSSCEIRRGRILPLVDHRLGW